MSGVWSGAMSALFWGGAGARVPGLQVERCLRSAVPSQTSVLGLRAVSVGPDAEDGLVRKAGRSEAQGKGPQKVRLGPASRSSWLGPKPDRKPSTGRNRFLPVCLGRVTLARQFDRVGRDRRGWADQA